MIAKVSLLLLSLVASFGAMAGKPTCHTATVNYCRYEGIVQNIYINNGNLVLFYFDTPLTPQDAIDVGYTVTHAGTAAFDMDDNSDFAKTFYSTALTAQASGRRVTIQMRGTVHGYLKFDRIWLPAP